MKNNTFFEKQQPPEPIHLMTEVTSILGSICKIEPFTIHFFVFRFWASAGFGINRGCLFCAYNFVFYHIN